MSFSLEALELCRQIRDNVEGATAANKALESSGRDLNGIVSELKAATANTNQAGKRLNRIAIECIALSDDLIKLLGDVRGASHGKRTVSVQATFRALKGNKKIEKLKNAVKEKQALLDTALTHDIW